MLVKVGLLIVAVAVIVLAITFGKKVPRVPNLELSISPMAIRPPSAVTVKVENYNDFPRGTKFTARNFGDGFTTILMVNGVCEITLSGDNYVEVEATTPQGAKTDKSIAVQLINNPPEFHNLMFAVAPSEKRATFFHLYYRTLGCDAIGAPTMRAGVRDPDHLGDLTDDWEYNVEITNLATGKQERVFGLDDSGLPSLLATGHFIKRAQFLWYPDDEAQFQEAYPYQFLLGLTYRPQNSLRDVGRVVTLAKPAGKEKVAVMACCGPTISEPPPEAPSNPTHEITVNVREFGHVYSERYFVAVEGSGCNNNA